MSSDHIQILPVYPIARYEANGEETSFTYAFAIFEPSNLEVYLNDRIVTSDFSVTGVGETAGGAVVFAVPPAAGTVVTLRRRVRAERDTDFQESGDLRAKVLNDQFDHLTAALQDVAADVTRAIRLPDYDPAGPQSLQLPSASQRRNKWLGFDAYGNLVVASGTTSSGGPGSGLPPSEVPTSSANWGEIQGTLSAQADLWTALAGKAAATHNHDEAYVPAGHAGSRGASHGAATTTTAGFMAAADKVKLNGIAEGAQVNLTASELVNALNTQLGGTGWQGSGTGAIWGNITGTLADQTDLYALLAGKAASGHGHATATANAAGYLSASDKLKLDGIEAGATADMTAGEIVDKVNQALGGTGWQSGGSGSGGVTWYDEQTALGQQAKIKFIGAGVAASVNGDTVEVNIAAQAVAAAGPNATLQFNNSGALAGAAGIKVRSPSNTAGYTNHVIEAVNYNYRHTRVDVESNGIARPDPSVGTMSRMVLGGNAAIYSDGMGTGADLETMIERAVSVVLVNAASATITVTTPTTGDGAWTNAWGADGGATTSFTMAAGARRTFTAVIGKNTDGSIYREWRGA